jgi:hypothetical protein
MPAISVVGVSADALSLKDHMDGVLSHLVDRFNFHNVPLPSKQYWKIGAPVIDCEQLVLSVGQVYIGLPGDPASEPMRSSSPRSVVFRAVLARCVPQPDARGNEPTPAKQQEWAEIQAVDSWTLLDAVAFLDDWDAVGAFGLGVIATIDVEDPQGGFQSIVATFTMAIP